MTNKDKASYFERFALSTTFPQPVEALLSWILAVSCLAVSGYYYVIQRLSGSSDKGALVPLVTTTREEMERCSPNERLQQLERLLESPVPDKDEKLVEIFRSDILLRRLATLAFTNPTQSCERTSPLATRLIGIWNKILPHPPSELSSYSFHISLILPCYNESMDEVRKRLEEAYRKCQSPSTVQLVIVLASHTDAIDQNTTCFPPWGDIKIIPFENGTGRGPCLNWGAHHADGAIYTFCHSDTTLPLHWDATIEAAFPHPTAFGFGIATPPRYVPGLRAVEVTANLRCQLWALPYGDQCLSIPAAMFDYIGGYPHQCFMEDYELVTLLRSQKQQHQMCMLPGPPALCSPRRWVTHGVLYVTFTNSRLVRAYKTEQTPAHEIYRQYYGRTLHVDELSPWEVELRKRLLG